MGGARRVLVLVHAVRTPEEAGVHLLLLRRLRARGVAVTTIAWDRGMAFLDLEGLGPVHEIESINRWRTPQVLARAGLRPAARLLRQRRVRRWWQQAGAPDAVLVLGPVRAEVAHYVPPGDRPVTALLAGRPLEDAESLAVTAALAPRALATTGTVADEARAAVPGWPVRTWTEVVDGSTPDPATRSATDRPLVVGLGPADWRGGADVFVRTAAALAARPGQGATAFAWVGLDPDDGRSFPHLFDVDHLGLADRFRWVHGHDDAEATLRAADAVLVTSRDAPPVGLVHPALDVLGARLLAGGGAPVVAFDTPAALALAGAGATGVTYPDVRAAAAALEAALAAGATAGLDDLLDRLLDHALGGTP